MTNYLTWFYLFKPILAIDDLDDHISPTMMVLLSTIPSPDGTSSHLNYNSCLFLINLKRVIWVLVLIANNSRKFLFALPPFNSPWVTKDKSPGFCEAFLIHMNPWWLLLQIKSRHPPLPSIGQGFFAVKPIWRILTLFQLPLLKHKLYLLALV